MAGHADDEITAGLDLKDGLEPNKMRVFDHIDLRVRDRARAQKFYSKILPAIRLVRDQSGVEWGAFDSGVEEKPTEFFAFTEDVNHHPNENRIAFWAETREAVDRIAKILPEAGARNVEGPQLWSEYSAGYYAVKTRTEINWRFAVAEALSLRIEKVRRNVNV